MKYITCIIATLTLSFCITAHANNTKYNTFYCPTQIVCDDYKIESCHVVGNYQQYWGEILGGGAVDGHQFLKGIYKFKKAAISAMKGRDLLQTASCEYELCYNSPDSGQEICSQASLNLRDTIYPPDPIIDKSSSWLAADIYYNHLSYLCSATQPELCAFSERSGLVIKAEASRTQRFTVDCDGGLKEYFYSVNGRFIQLKISDEILGHAKICTISLYIEHPILPHYPNNTIVVGTITVDEDMRVLKTDAITGFKLTSINIMPENTVGLYNGN